MRDQVMRAIDHNHPNIHINDVDEVLLRHGYKVHGNLIALS